MFCVFFSFCVMPPIVKFAYKMFIVKHVRKWFCYCLSPTLMQTIRTFESKACLVALTSDCLQKVSPVFLHTYCCKWHTHLYFSIFFCSFSLLFFGEVCLKGILLWQVAGFDLLHYSQYNTWRVFFLHSVFAGVFQTYLLWKSPPIM